MTSHIYGRNTIAIFRSRPSYCA